MDKKEQKISDEDKKKIISSVINAFNSSENVIKKQKTYWEKYLYNFFQKYYNSDEENYYNNRIFVPLVQETILTLRPLLALRRTKFRVLPSTSSLKFVPSEEDITQILSWLDSQYFTQNLFKKKKELAFYILLYGFGVLYFFYNAKKKTVRYKKFDDMTGEVRVVKEDYLIYDDPDCKVLDPSTEFFPDPTGSDIDNAKYVILRKFISPSELKQLEETGWVDEGVYDEWYEMFGKGLYSRDSSDYSLQKTLREGTSSGGSINTKGKNTIEYIEYWEDDKLIIVINRSILGRKSENPYWYKRKPFCIIFDEDIPRSLFGLGEGEILDSLQSELNTVRRLRLDNSKRVIRKKYRVRRGANVDESQILDENRLIIELDDPAGDMLPFELDDIHKAGIVETSDIRIDAQRVTGVTDPFKGLPIGSTGTATEVSIMQQNTMSRLHYKASNFDEGMLEWAKWSFELARQFYPPQKVIFHKSENEWKIKEITYDVFTKEYVFNIADPSTELISKQEKLMLADLLFARFVNNPLIRQKDLLKKILDLIGGEPLLELVKTDEELQQEQIQAQITAEQQKQEELKEKLGDAYVNKIVPEIIKNSGNKEA